MLERFAVFCVKMSVKTQTEGNENEHFGWNWGHLAGSAGALRAMRVFLWKLCFIWESENRVIH